MSFTLSTVPMEPGIRVPWGMGCDQPTSDGISDNFALHVSLETPDSGANDASQHTGYTSRQYDALAIVLSDWIKRFKLSPAAITTHRHVDLGGERSDPRSFNWASLQYRLAALGDLCVS